jgi:hypothetical protein
MAQSQPSSKTLSYDYHSDGNYLYLRSVFDPLLEQLSQKNTKDSKEIFDQKIQTFNNKVLTSLAVQHFCPTKVSLTKRWFCFFDQCISNNLSFSKRERYLVHIIKDHYLQLPANGNFLINFRFEKLNKLACKTCCLYFNSRNELTLHNKQHHEKHFYSDLDRFIASSHLSSLNPVSSYQDKI